MRLRPALVAALALVALSGTARAQSAGDERFRQFCTGDYMRLCSQFEAGSPQVRQCFIANMRSVSPRCRRAISASRGSSRKHRRHRRR